MAACAPSSGPIICWILYIWSRSDSPGKSGSPSMSSPMMQPMAHTSTSGPYMYCTRVPSGPRNGGPSNSSGERYHRVAT
eukprot:351382-Chlamydomonas_euryale.AAC.2